MNPYQHPRSGDIGDSHGPLSQARRLRTTSRLEIDRTILKLETELARLHLAVAAHERELAVLRRLQTAIVDGAEDRGVFHGDGQFAPRRRERKTSKAWKVRQLARDVLLEKCRPLTRSMLLEEMTARGLNIDGPKAAKEIGKILWQADEFISTDSGYWLRDEVLPDVGS